MELPLTRPPATMTEQYYDAYCAAAQMRLSSRPTARLWWGLDVGAQVAGAWARNGFTPQVAWELMLRGITPEQAASAASRTP